MTPTGLPKHGAEDQAIPEAPRDELFSRTRLTASRITMLLTISPQLCRPRPVVRLKLFVCLVEISRLKYCAL